MVLNDLTEQGTILMLRKDKPIVVLSLFDGISCGLQALKNQGFIVEKYFASEIDKNAIKVSQDNHPEIIRLGDVTTVGFKNGLLYSENGSWDIGQVDLVLAGSPCQGFSMAGKQLNFDDPRSKLYFEFKRILNECRGSTSQIKLHVDFLLENVNMKKEYIEYIENDLTCWALKINSRHFSAQNRPRFYWTNLIDELDKLQMKFTINEGSDPHITTILEDQDYNGVWTWPRGYNKGGTRLVDKVPCLTTSSWQHNFLVEKSDGSRRKFTPVEAERCQGLSDGYTKILSDNQRYIVLGNCWTVPVIEQLLSFDKENNINFMENIA